MTKISRWRGGLKGGNRRESDMTKGSFNQEFNMVSSRTLMHDNIQKDLKWRFKLKEDEGDNQGLLFVDREEEGNFISRSKIGDLVISSSFHLDSTPGMYSVEGSMEPRVSAVRRLNSGTDGVAVGNYTGRVALVTTDKNQLFHVHNGDYVNVIETGGMDPQDFEDFDYFPVQVVSGSIMTPFSVATSLTSISIWTQTPDISYQVKITYVDTGQLLFISESDYNFEHSLGEKTVLGLNTLYFTPQIPLDANRQIDVTLRTLSPILIGGLGSSVFYMFEGNEIIIHRLQPPHPKTAIPYWGLPEDLEQGWYICDGSNGTPDLRGQFIRGVTNSEDLLTTHSNTTRLPEDIDMTLVPLTTEEDTHSHTVSYTDAFNNMDINTLNIVPGIIGDTWDASSPLINTPGGSTVRGPSFTPEGTIINNGNLYHDHSLNDYSHIHNIQEHKHIISGGDTETAPDHILMYWITYLG